MTSPTLLLVDDEPAVLSSLRRVFQGCAYRILTSQSGADALSLLRAERVDLILTDHLMPGMTGIQLLREAREQVPGVFRILISAYVDTDAILSASNNGTIQRFIEKPFSDDEVRAIVAEFLERRQVRERRDFLEALIESCPDPIALTDKEGRITYVNGPASELLGDLPERLIGSDTGEMFVEREKDVAAIRAQLKQEGRVRSHETVIRTSRGPVPISLSMAPLLDAQGRRNGFFGIAKDITSRRQTEAELRHRNQELAALNNFALAAMGRPNPELILNRAIDALEEVTAIDAAALYVYDADEQCFRLRARRGIPDPLAERIATLSDPEWRRRPALGSLVVRVGEEIRRTSEGQAIANEGFGTCAYTPIVWNDEVNALLVIARRSAGPLDASIERLLPAIGAMAGTSLENSVLFERRQREAEQTALLHQIADAARGSLNVEEVLNRAVRWTASALHVDRAAVTLYREDQSAVGFRQGLEGSMGCAEECDLGLAPACVSRVHSRGITVSEDLARDSVASRCLPSPEREGVRALMEAPIVYQGRWLGVLHVGSDSHRRWKREEIQLLERIALELAITVHNARTERELRQTLDALEEAKAAVERQAEETSALYRLSRTITHVLDIDELLSLTAESVLAATRARAAGVIFKREERTHTALLACGEVEDAETDALRDAIREAARTTFGAPVQELESAPIRCAGVCDSPAGAVPAGEASSAPDLVIAFRLADQDAGLFWIRPHGKQPFPVWEEKLVKTIALQTSSTLERLLDAIDTERRKIQAMVEGMSEPVVLLDDRFSVVSLNASARRLLELEDAHGRFDPAWIRPLALRRLFLRAARDPGRVLLEEDIVFERPEPRVYHVVLSPVTEAAGRRIGTAAMFHDVTARREVEQMKSEFVAHVSHELRTPLTSVKEAIALLLDGVVGTISEGQREFLEMANRETDRLVRLINDVLELSRIESSRLYLNRAPIFPRAIAESVLGSFEIVAERAGIRLSFEGPASASSILLDADRLTQILVILVDNAIKFTPRGGAVTISLEDGREALVLCVSDTGCGIPEAELDAIFEKFHQLPGAGGPQARGTGLGLSIARGLVEMHGGTIRVSSRLGEGSTFTITLPRLEASGAVEEYLESRMIRARAEESGFGLIAIGLRTEGGEEASQGIRERAAALLRRSVYKPGDRLFPQGDARFVIVLERTHAQGVSAVQERLARALREELPEVEASWSRAVYPEDGTTPAELLEAVGAASPGPAGPEVPARPGQV